MMNRDEDFLDEYDRETRENPNTMKDCCSTGCCLMFLAPFFAIMMVVAIFAFSSVTHGYWSEEVAKAYEGGEPDYSDGDLEDKLGDSGYYADLFPEEVEDDYKDDNYSSRNRSYSSGSKKTDINNPIVSYYHDVGLNGINNVTNNGITIIVKDLYGKEVYRIVNGHMIFPSSLEGKTRAWIYDNDKWYLYDISSGTFVKEQLVEDNGAVYYLQMNGVMAKDTYVTLAGKLIAIDKEGKCKIVA